jgi:hypothetical protein
LPFIGSTGTQYVNTDVIPTTETRVLIEFELTSPPANASTWHSVFGSRTSSGSGDQFNIATDSQNSYAGFVSQEITVTQPYNKANTRYVVDISKNGVIVNGVKAGTYNSGLNVVSSYPMYVFGRNNAGTFGNGITGNVMSMQIYTNGSLIRDYIPCETDSGEVGLWDTVDLRFYGNAGRGAFINPLAPVGDHNAYISGVAREIEGVFANIGGVGREVKSGTVLIDGVIREISLSSGPYEVSVEWYPGGESTYSSIYWPITVGGQSVTVGDVLVVDEGTTIIAGARTPNSTYADSRVYMNGSKVAGGTSMNKTYSYTFEVTGPVTIQLKTNKSGRNFTGGWTYVTME